VSDFLKIDIECNVGSLTLRLLCSFSAPRTVLFGPSGAGKTSLLRVVAGLIRPDRGLVALHGRTLVDVERSTWISPGERSIGFVTQRPALFPHMSVAENVSFGLSGLNRARREDWTRDLLETFHAAHLSQRKPASLSGGEKQRVALARALAREPQLLLLDEPFSGMDADLKVTLLGELTRWLDARNVPLIYVSHDVLEAFETGTEVALLRDGQIEAQGPVRTVLADKREQLLRRLER
jgi:molybdate transport system ATP-binding protein